MMKEIILVVALSASAVSMASQATIKVIYGADNRVEVSESKNPLFVKLAASTAAMIETGYLEELNSEQYILEGQELQSNGKCETERFSKQPAVASCSGFLVAKNILVTAGHCVVNEDDCAEVSWVFDYKVEYSDQTKVVVDKSNVYKCRAIISRKLDGETMNDYAVIELDREALDRAPLKVRSEGTPKKGDRLVVIGHPSGLPTKIADGAAVRDVGDIFLVTNLDTYGGNSGSPVFSTLTGEVEGILVRGDTDYIFDEKKDCAVSNRIGNSEGRGEDVTLISAVRGIPVQEVEPPKVINIDEEIVIDDDDNSTPRRAQRRLPWWSRVLRWLRGIV